MRTIGVEGGEEEAGEEAGAAGSRRQQQLLLLQTFMLPLGQLCWWEAREPSLLPANHHTGMFDMYL